MPQFDYSLKTPQGQVQSDGPRDQGTGIRVQTANQLAQGMNQIAASVVDIEKQRVTEQAQSDMSAFQADRIKREQAFREKAATITNAGDYKKAVDKYITDLNKHAAGKREDGTKVFRNGMGSAAYKEFNKGYSAKFQAAGSEHSFQLDRKRDKLNYRMSINSGIKNNNPDAINQSYEQLVNSGHLTAEEATIEKEGDIKKMTLNHFAQTKATMLLGAEELLIQSTDLKQTTKTITDAYEVYKAEVYTNKNLEETERKNLLTNAKAGLMAISHKVKGQQKAADLQMKQNYTQAETEYENILLNDPDADPEETLQMVQEKFSTIIKPEDNLKMLKDLNAHQNRRLKAETSKKDAVDMASNDIAAEDEAYSYDPKNDPKGNRFRDIKRRVSRMPSSSTKTDVINLMNDKSPFNKKGSSPISEFTSSSMNQMKAELGLNLTEAEFKKLASDRKEKPWEHSWYSTSSTPFTAEQEAHFKDSTEKFYDFTPESMRQNYLNKVMRDAQRMFQDGDPEKAKAHIEQELNILKKEQNDLKQIENYLKESKPRNTNVYSFLK